MSDASELFRNCFKYLGHSINDTSPELIKQAEAMLIKQKPNIKSFHEDNGQDLLASGEVDVVMEYNGDIAQVMAEDDDLDFVVPKEGAMKQSDTLAIPKGAPHPDNALKFINFILDAKVGAEISKTIKYPSPNAAAVALMPASYKRQPGDLSAGGDHGQMRVSALPRSGFHASARRSYDAAACGLIRAN